MGKEVDAVKDEVVGCWALPNNNRPIDTSWLKKMVKALEKAADKGADSLSAEIDTQTVEAKGKIAEWCNKGQSATHKKYCPCKFNCKGNDNNGKKWKAENYECVDNCNEDGKKESKMTCDEAKCKCGKSLEK